MITLLGLYLAGFILTVALFRHVWDMRTRWEETASYGAVWARTIALSVMWPGFWVILAVSTVSPTFRSWIVDDAPPRRKPPTQWTEDRL